MSRERRLRRAVANGAQAGTLPSRGLDGWNGSVARSHLVWLSTAAAADLQTVVIFRIVLEGSESH
jgi:hypothetical protein